MNDIVKVESIIFKFLWNKKMGWKMPGQKKESSTEEKLQIKNKLAEF